jgi:hypothetical protein
MYNTNKGQVMTHRRLSTFRSLTSTLTLICFLFQILCPSYLLAFHDFYQKEYTSLEFQAIDNNTVNIIVNQKGSGDTHRILEQCIPIAHLRSLLSFQDLFPSRTDLPEALAHLRLKFSLNNELSVETSPHHTLSAHLYIKMPGSISLQNFVGKNLFCESYRLVTREGVALQSLFYKNQETGRLIIENPLLCQAVFVENARLFIRTSEELPPLHSFGNVVHEEGLIKGAQLTLHEGVFMAESDLILETIRGDNGSLKVMRNTDQTRIKRMTGTFNLVECGLNGTLGVGHGEKFHEDCFIEDLVNYGLTTISHSVSAKRILNYKTLSVYGLNEAVLRKIAYILWETEHLIQQVEPPYLPQQQESLLLEAKENAEQLKKHALAQPMPGTSTSYQEIIDYKLWWAEHQKELSPSMTAADAAWARREAEELGQQAVAPIKAGADYISWKLHHDITRRTPAYRYTERDDRLSKLYEKLNGAIENEGGLTIEDGYVGENQPLTNLRGQVTFKGNSILKCVAVNKSRLNLLGQAQVMVIQNLCGGLFTAEGSLTYEGAFHNDGEANFNGVMTFSGPIDNNGLLVSTKGVFYAHHEQFSNNTLAKMQIDRLHWIKGDYKKFHNGGNALFGQLEGNFSIDNLNKLTVRGKYDLKSLTNHGNPTGRAETVLNGEGSIIHLVNAGKFKATQKLTVSDRFENHGGAEMEIHNLHWVNPHYRALKNEGELFIDQCDGEFYPRIIHNDGLLKFHYKKGAFDEMLYLDRSTSHSGIIDGVEFSQVKNLGTFFLSCGYYWVHHCENEGLISLDSKTPGDTRFYATQINNPGRLEAKGDLGLKHTGQNWGNVVVDGDLHVFLRKGVNGCDDLSKHYRGRSVFYYADYFHNHQAQSFHDLNAVLCGDDFQNWAKLIFKGLTVYSKTFIQHNMAVLGAKAGLHLKIDGDVDNRHGIIHAKGNGFIKAGGNVLNGAPAESAEHHYRHFHDGYRLTPNPHQDAGYMPEQFAHVKRAQNGAYIKTGQSLRIQANALINSFGSIASGPSSQEFSLSLEVRRLLCEAGQIESAGKACLKGNAFIFTAPPVCGEDIDDLPYWKRRWREVESGPRSTFLVQGDLHLLTPTVLVRGSNINILGDFYDTSGAAVNLHQSSLFQIKPLKLFHHNTHHFGLDPLNENSGGLFFSYGASGSPQEHPSCFLYSHQSGHRSHVPLKAERGPDFIGYCRGTMTYGCTSAPEEHIPSTINVGGTVNLNFTHYDAQGAGLFAAGGDLTLKGDTLKTDGRSCGTVRINPLQRHILALNNGVVAYLAPFILQGGNPHAKSSQYIALCRSRFWGGDTCSSRRCDLS